jgi:calcium-translocating P-type ATPase
LLLWAAAGLAFLAQLPQLGWAILAIILLNAGFSFWQEYRAGQVVESLRRRMPLASRVLRDGVEHRVKVRELAPGDVIVLQRGDRVPADARVLRDSGLRLDYSILTGESEAVRRGAGNAEGASLADAPNCVLAGTTVMEGSGEALVFATGGGTAFGQVAALTQQLRIEASPLQKELAVTARTIAVVAVIVGTICVSAGSLTGRLTEKDAFIFGLGILVALIPEGLLPTVSLALALGVQRMAGRNAIVKRLSSVETLGSTGVICTDKTGTITSSEMTVREVWAAGRRYTVTGRESSLRGSVKAANPGGDSDPESLTVLLRCAVLCNNGIPPHPHRHRAGLGDPLDEALLVMAIKGGMDPDEERGKWPRLKEYTFDASRRRMSTLHQDTGGQTLFVKGGPAEVLARCSRELKNGEPALLDDKRREEILRDTTAVSVGGRRLLAMAYREWGTDRLPETPEEAERDLAFLGLVIIDNPLRPEVPGAIARCKTAGITVVMLTGDHAHTALAVARDAGIDDGDGVVVTGQEVEEMGDAALREMLELRGPTVFARVTPEQKLRLVEAYRAMGKIVAVTGDGVNDAPALRAADIGVAMGRRGTDVARDAADMVLMDDNFATIVSAIEEGRGVYDNIRKFLAYFLTSNVAEAAPFLLFVLAGVPLPLTVLQVLLVDLGTDILPGLALGIDPPERGVMAKHPREAGERMVNAALLLRALGSLGVVAAALSLAGYFIVQWDMTGTLMGDFVGEGELYRQATTVTLAGIVACQVGNAFACRSERDSVLATGLIGNPMLLWAIGAEVAMLAAIIGVPWIADVFDLEPIDPMYWPMLATFPFLFLAAEEARKLVARRLGRRPS